MIFAADAPALRWTGERSAYPDGTQFSVMLCGLPFTVQIYGKADRVRYLAFTRADREPDANAFAELSALLRRRFGNPSIVTSASVQMQPCEQWLLENGILNHFCTDREHLHLSFYI